MTSAALPRRMLSTRDARWARSLAAWLGFAAVTAVFTAYVRLLGGSVGTTQHFIGPMAKQHRMFTLTVASLVAALESILGAPGRALPIGLAVIIAGSMVTAIRRTRRILDE